VDLLVESHAEPCSVRGTAKLELDEGLAHWKHVVHSH
jgi:hypothetical protein